MISLKRIGQGKRLRQLMRNLAQHLANCWRGEHEWGFNPMFGTMQCIHCGRVSHADLKEEIRKLHEALDNEEAHV